MKSHKSKHSKIISFIIIFILFISLFLLFIGTNSSYYSYKENNRLNTFVYSESPFFHDKSPKYGKNQNHVFIIKYFDPDSLTTKKFYPIYKNIVIDYFDKGIFIFRYINNNQNSIYAIKMLEAARKQYDFRNMLDFLFENFTIWSSHYDNNPDKLWNIIPSYFDKNKLKKDFDNINVSDIVKTDSENANLLDISHSPTIYVNNTQLKSLSKKSLISLIENNLLILN